MHQVREVGRRLRQRIEPQEMTCLPCGCPAWRCRYQTSLANEYEKGNTPRRIPHRERPHQSLRPPLRVHLQLAGTPLWIKSAVWPQAILGYRQEQCRQQYDHR